MEPATEASSVPYTLSENKENVMKLDTSSVSKSHGEVIMPEKSKTETSGSKRSSRVSKRKASRSESSDSSRSRSRDSSVERVVSAENSKDDDSFSQSHEKSEYEKPKPEISECKRGRQNSRKDKRKNSRSSSSDSSGSCSRNSSIEKVEKSNTNDSSKEKSKSEISECRQGRQNSRKDKRKISRSGSSDSSRSHSRNSSKEKVEKINTEDSSKEKSKSDVRECKRSRQNSSKDSRSGSSDKSKSRSRSSSVEKIATENISKEKSKPEISEHKRGRPNSRKDKKRESRSRSSDSSRSHSRNSSVEKVEKIEASFKEKSEPEISECKQGKQNSRKDKRKNSRSGSSDSSRSHSRNSSIEKEKIITEVSSKADAGSVSKSHDDAVEKEKLKETPQKRLKIKRDNVIVSDLAQSTKKDSSEAKLTIIEKNTDTVVDEVVDKNITETTKEIEPQPATKYVSTRKIRISGRKLSEKSEEEPKVKRGKWGSFSSSQKSQAISISTDSLKNWFPDFKLLKNPDVINEAIEEMQVVSKEENTEHQTEKMDENKHTSQNIDMKDEQAPEQVEQIDESEATTILFIQNLVRPFTLLQLKELLKETGKFIEEKFWIDKIKSKCFVTYSTVEEAIKTKTALNGTRWPSSNPKILSVEYSTEEELELHQSGSEPPKSLPPPPLVENPEPLEDHSLEDARRKDREHQERRRERSKPQPVREWDKNKLTQESPNRERVGRSIERSRSSDKKEKKDTKRRPNEDTPAKLLDDLFQKTKSSPCIYWLPLTEEQVIEREEARRLRRLEREKRNQLREQEEAEQKAKAEQSRNRTREMERRRSSTRSRSPVSRRR